MKFLIAFLSLVPLVAQEAQKPAEPVQEAKPSAEAKAEEKAASPFPAEDSWVSGAVDVGYRWVQDVQGNANTYRSVVNLTDGIRLIGVDLTLRDPKKRMFDRADLFVHNWGDPYNTLRADVSKTGWYRFVADYRSTNYFNNLESFANPLLSRGSVISERAYDMSRKYTNVDMELLPGRWITPYFSYTRDWNNGTGVFPYVTDSNEYAVPMSLKDNTDNFRGGVRLQYKSYHATLEGGGTQYSEDNSVNFTGSHYGNRTTPVFPSTQPQVLNRLTQLYGITGDSRYTRAMLTGAPAKWLSFYGQFLYSQPKTNVTYNDAANGLFVLASTLQLYNGLQDTASSLANQPRTSANFGFELKPYDRIRITYGFSTDRLHNASSVLLNQQLMFGGTVTPQTAQSLLTNNLFYNYNQHRIDAAFDVTSKLTVRGGFHYVWGDTRFPAGTFNAFATSDVAEIQQKIGVGGFTYRPTRKWSVNADYEGAKSPMVYFRTSLRDYQRLRTRARYQATASLNLSGSFSFFDNQNPTPGVNYDARQQMTSLSVQWTPKGAKMFSLLGDYTRSTFRSDINALDPSLLQPFRSFYRDNAHISTALGEFKFPAVAGRSIRAEFGGSLFMSSGTRPTNYYQPIGRLVVPFVKKVQWYGEWRWYGYNESFYMYEDFRTNQFLTGLRFGL